MAMVKKISILGSTGSIGRSTLEVITENRDYFDIVALTAGRNIELLTEQIKKFHPRYVAVYSEKEADLLKKSDLPDPAPEIGYGQEGQVKAAGFPDNDIVLNALVGAAGLMASLETIKAGTNLALANKESLVVGGPLFEKESLKTKARILPVDSEHSAIWQCLYAGRDEEVRQIILTASGGPFRDRPIKDFDSITVEEALNHPTWKMGPKITIDSATLVNKGLELIEAVWLFSIPADKIKIVIHPQSIVHSMVEYVDSSVVAQLSEPDMCLPIACALFWPERIEQNYGRMDWTEIRNLSFEPPDLKRFPALQLAFEVAAEGGTAPAIYNAANEIAVEAFLGESVKFTEIVDITRKTLNEIEFIGQPDLEDILKADSQARELAGRIREKMAC